ncbi:MAG: DUF362 domain-containing protein [Spirochaetes bacterium]|nr:DUF362 domain-containing protein [Spirochaetota bacterium]
MAAHSAEKHQDPKIRNHKITVKKIVAVEPCTSYNPDKTYPALKKALDAIRYKCTRGCKVLIKPNIIGQNTPDQATTTHPGIIDAVCRYFKELGCAITIGDSSAFYQGGCTLAGMEKSGIAAVAGKYGASIVPFETTRLRKITSGRYLNPFYVTEAVFDHDLVVNVPKLKLHRLARYTGAIKNVYGCVVGGSKQLYHKQFQHRDDYQDAWGKPIVDVYEAVSPRLTIMDAVIGLDKNGPAANGEPRFTGLVLASESGPALDMVACRIIGYDPMWVPAVREAMERGLVSAAAVRTIGAIPSIPYVKLPDIEIAKGVAGKIDDYFFDQFIVHPHINRKKCTRCDACVEKCAVKAISYDRERLPVIDSGLCINCYCCESYCGKGAITLRGSAANLLMRGMRLLMKL